MSATTSKIHAYNVPTPTDKPLKDYERIADTIWAQLGGRHFAVMCGVKLRWRIPGLSKNEVSERGDGIVSQGALAFDFKGSRKANHCRVTLTWADEYVIQFWKVSKAKGTRTLVQAYGTTSQGVFASQLQELFTEFTGLYTHL